MSRRVTPNTSPAPGSMLRGTPMSTTSSARPERAVITASMSLRSTSRSCAPVDASSTSHASSASGISSSVMARPPTRAGELLGARCGAVGDDDLEHAGAGERERHAFAHRPGAEHEHAAVVERAEAAGGERHRGRRHRHRVTADGGLGAGPLAHLDRVTERAREHRPAGGLLLGEFHASRTWPRISPSPMIIESRPAATPNRCATAASSWYVYSRSANSSGSTPDEVGEEVAHVLHRRVEQRGVRVDLGAVARRQQHDLGEVLGLAASDWSALGSASGATAMRSRSSTGTVRWFRPTTTRDMPGASPWLRPRAARIRSSMPESSADCQSGSSLERPDARSSSRASDSRSNSVAYSGPNSCVNRPPQPRGQGRAAPAGADGDHEIALAHDRREGERAVGRVVGRVHPDPPGLARLEHRVVDGGDAGGRGRQPGAVEVGGREAPFGQR